ncbi:MAG: nuclear transport factor 2 family protein [Melioribacteraceae bacterium]
MRYFIVILSIGFFLTSCTKEVPETEKKQLKSYEEKNVRQTIENFTAAYNSNDIEKAVSFFESDYKGTVGDSEEITGLEALKNDLIQYRKQYAEGSWEINIEEIGISGEQAYVLTNSSFLMPDPIERKLNPIYSERAIRILKKQKNDGWKIYRYLATPTFTYDQK